MERREKTEETTVAKAHGVRRLRESNRLALPAGRRSCGKNLSGRMREGRAASRQKAYGGESGKAVEHLAVQLGNAGEVVTLLFQTEQQDNVMWWIT